MKPSRGTVRARSPQRKTRARSPQRNRARNPQRNTARAPRDTKPRALREIISIRKPQTYKWHQEFWKTQSQCVSSETLLDPGTSHDPAKVRKFLESQSELESP